MGFFFSPIYWTALMDAEWRLEEWRENGKTKGLQVSWDSWETKRGLRTFSWLTLIRMYGQTPSLPLCFWDIDEWVCQLELRVSQGLSLASPLKVSRSTERPKTFFREETSTFLKGTKAFRILMILTPSRWHHSSPSWPTSFPNLTRLNFECRRGQLTQLSPSACDFDFLQVVVQQSERSFPELESVLTGIPLFHLRSSEGLRNDGHSCIRKAISLIVVQRTRLHGDWPIWSVSHPRYAA